MAEETTAAIDALASWKDYRGSPRFASANSSHAIDRANSLLSGATSILSMLASAAEDASALVGSGKPSDFNNRNGSTLAGALEGVSDLISLAAFLVEG